MDYFVVVTCASVVARVSSLLQTRYLAPNAPIVAVLLIRVQPKVVQATRVWMRRVEFAACTRVNVRPQAGWQTLRASAATSAPTRARSVIRARRVLTSKTCAPSFQALAVSIPAPAVAWAGPRDTRVFNVNNVSILV